MYEWRQAANCGGGYGQVADVDGQNLILAGDMWGVYRSINGAMLWRASNLGSPNIVSGRAIAFSNRPATKGWAFLGHGVSHGTRAGTGYFGVVSPDGEIRPVDTTHGLGLGALSEPNAKQPRPAGRIIVPQYDVASDREWVYVFGPLAVMRYVNDGAHDISSSNLGPVVMNSMKNCWKAAVLYDASTILAATFTVNQDGAAQTPKVYKFTNIQGNATATSVKSGLAVNGFRWVRGKLYAACTTGLYRVDSPTAWVKVGSFDRIVTDVAGDEKYLYVGQADPALNMPIGHAVARSGDDGKTWQYIASKTSGTLFGSTETWWLAATYPNGSLSGKGMDVQELGYADGTLYAFGRKGCWASIDQGVTWFPAVRGIGGSVVNNVWASGSSVNAKDEDWIASSSEDRMVTAKKAAVHTYPTPARSLGWKRVVNGKTYQFVDSSPCDFLVDGVSVADDLFRSSLVKGNVEDFAVADGTIYVGSSGGGLLVGDQV